MSKSEGCPNSEQCVIHVHKSSPHIWSGGLEDVELAKWLIGKANAILSQHKHHAELELSRARTAELAASAKLINSYADLGLSRKECDPIPPLSTEAIQFEVARSDVVLQQGSDLLTLEGPVPPLEYSLLPDLCEELKEFQQKKVALFAHNLAPYESKENGQVL